MTFAKFEALFKRKYPNGEVVAHGKFGGTEHNAKTTVIFNKGGKCYEYYGSYESVLNRVGVKIITRASYNSVVATLERYKRDNGKQSLFGVLDYDNEIEYWSRELERYNTEFEIV